MAINTNQDATNLTLAERFEIDPASPSGLRWKTTGRGYKPGDVVGSMNRKGYWKVGKPPNKMMVHRVIHELSHGLIPLGYEIDHRDGNPSNNHPDNLRACSHGQNGQNRRGSASNDWYPKGININAHTGAVQGIIGKDGKQLRPGRGFNEDRDPSSEALNGLVVSMRQAIEELHGPYANLDSYYCQLPDEAVFGVAEGL
ncbi:HNH endonuclease signature motif containing protein [Pseudomonas sp.]|uniref:HNH endonuclease signature motif containing protein n=1 Tax=Pseudomonas sp. TaxID=306 RepID=UPI003FD8BF77